MGRHNFQNDSITYPYPADTELREADIVHHDVQQVLSGGYLKISREWSLHFVAWLPLVVNGSLRTTTLNDVPSDQVKPSYVQDDGHINIGPKDDWGGKHVAFFVLKEQLTESHRTAAED